MTRDQFSQFCRLLRDRSGIAISEDKRYLVEARLGPLAAARGFDGLAAMAARLISGADRELERAVVEAMTTNETYFFRDGAPFRLIETVVLPALRTRRAAQKRIRIWSAACSSGQEPYSIAMLLDDRAPDLAGWSIEIVATDLSSKMVEKARRGEYTQFEVQRGLPIAALLKHFTQTGEWWRANDSVRRRVSFRQMNLLENFAALGSFDLILCRNVLIYFDAEAKADVLARLARATAHGGFLMLGAAESPLGYSTAFAPVEGSPSLYTAQGAPAAFGAPPLRAAAALA